MKLKHIAIVLVVTGLLLLVPYLGNWPWETNDYVIGSVLIFIAGLAIAFAATRAQSASRKAVTILVVLGVFLYIWAELAVGIFTNLGS